GKMLEGIVDVLREKKEYLNRLDAEIGDGDHGRTIAFSGGTATGPLFGTAFIEAGKAIEGRREIRLEDWSRSVKAAEEGIKKRGRVEVGEKTMLDTVHSVSESLQNQ
ncbi:unnamed protein product, partial [marine sediment metagenome]